MPQQPLLTSYLNGQDYKVANKLASYIHGQVTRTRLSRYDIHERTQRLRSDVLI